QPTITRVVQGGVGGGGSERAVGKPLESALIDDVRMDCLVELEVNVGKGAKAWPARVIGAPAPDGEMHWYLTTLSADCLPAEDAQAAYSMRWEVELVFKAL